MLRRVAACLSCLMSVFVSLEFVVEICVLGAVLSCLMLVFVSLEFVGEMRVVLRGSVLGSCA